VGRTVSGPHALVFLEANPPRIKQIFDKLQIAPGAAAAARRMAAISCSAMTATNAAGKRGARLKSPWRQAAKQPIGE
jgi:hypothetical protein